MKNRWTGNIPVNGILCRDTRSGNIYRVMRLSKDPHDKYCLVDDSCHVHDIVDTVPLTPQEVWDLMPWQPIDSAPIEKIILIKRLNGNVLRAEYKLGGWSITSPIDGSVVGISQAVAWLPLPEIK